MCGSHEKEQCLGNAPWWCWVRSGFLTYTSVTSKFSPEKRMLAVLHVRLRSNRDVQPPTPLRREPERPSVQGEGVPPLLLTAWNSLAPLPPVAPRAPCPITPHPRYALEGRCQGKPPEGFVVSKREDLSHRTLPSISPSMRCYYGRVQRRCFPAHAPAPLVSRTSSWLAQRPESLWTSSHMALLKMCLRSPSRETGND